MPNFKKPPNLFDASLRTIVNSILKAAQNVLVRSNSSIELDCNIIRNYVSEIPSVCADEYMAEVLSVVIRLPKEKQSKELLANMLHPRCHRIEMQQFYFRKYSQYLTRALVANLERMPELEWLEVSPWSDCKETTMFVELHIHALNNLQVVDLYLDCTSTVLRALVKNCPCLRRFRALSAEIQKPEVQLLSHLKHLKYVSISINGSEDITDDIAYLICNLPSLQCIEYDHIEEIISVIKKWHLEGKVVPPFSLKSFGDEPQNIKALDTLCSYFPFLESLNLEPVQSVRTLKNFKFLKYLSVNDVVADDLFNFLLETTCNLYELTIHSSISLHNLFNLTNGVLLSTLKELNIDICRGINLEAIQNLLPNLETLTIGLCVRIPSLNERIDGAPRAFSKLKRLSIIGSFDASHLRYLLSGCEDLEDLYIGGKDSFHQPNFSAAGMVNFVRAIVTDELWMELTKTNPMKNLRRLAITSDCLTRNVIPKMIQSFDDLELLLMHGSQWINELPEDEAHALLEFLKPFDVRLFVFQNSKEVISYNTGSEQLSLKEIWDMP